MEANENMAPENQAPEAPAFEQDIMDTQEALNTADNSFEQAMGLPMPPETRAPQPEDTTGPAQPPVQQDFTQNEVQPETNDQVRYQYWQSEAAKLKNQLDEVKEYAPMVDYLRANPEAVQSITPGGKPAEAAPTSQEQEEFPPPPVKPEQPRGFSREEAMNDSNSESAQYLDSVDSWRDDMMQYNSLANQYEVAKLRESYSDKIKGLEEVNKQREVAVQQAQEMNNVRNYVNQKYDLGDNVDDFINTMNDPKSINMDDLVGYYKYKNGMATNNTGTIQKPTITPPSKSFKQVQRAQSVPAPMGVQPAQSNAPSDPTDNFMDAIVKSNNNTNIL
tara:strand:- start:3133 stop:4131 length:999 start_codon:yes stop_codon:yes gene_type:complete